MGLAPFGPKPALQIASFFPFPLFSKTFACFAVPRFAVHPPPNITEASESTVSQNTFQCQSAHRWFFSFLCYVGLVSVQHAKNYTKKRHFLSFSTICIRRCARVGDEGMYIIKPIKLSSPSDYFRSPFMPATASDTATHNRRTKRATRRRQGYTTEDWQSRRHARRSQDRPKDAGRIQAKGTPPPRRYRVRS